MLNSRIKTKENIMEEEFKLEETILNDDDIINPGDCIGHWEENNESCNMCEIESSCKNMTLTLKENPVEK
jgi:hypothetical protein